VTRARQAHVPVGNTNPRKPLVLRLTEKKEEIPSWDGNCIIPANTFKSKPQNMKEKKIQLNGPLEKSKIPGRGGTEAIWGIFWVPVPSGP